ncbi:MAG TPA: polyamine ABC transporter substrate-binding protein, partial [Achromobacter sp.]|nr:polyamine ABC transporter substrate-binding protein [Achromobacter sp.]
MKRPVPLALAAALLAVCSTGLATPAQAQERPVLRVSSGAADNATLDPHRATSTADKGVAAQMFDALVQFPPGSADPKA